MNWKRGALNETGVLIESPPLYENLTARENLYIRTALLGLPESHIDEVLSIVDLTDTGKNGQGNFQQE